MSQVLVLVKAAMAIAVAGYLGICALLYIFQARLLFPGAFMPLPPGIEAEGRRLGLQPFNLVTTDGESVHLLRRAAEPGAAGGYRFPRQCELS